MTECRVCGLSLWKCSLRAFVFSLRRLLRNPDSTADDSEMNVNAEADAALIKGSPEHSEDMPR